MDILGTLLLCAAVGDLVVLLLEELQETWAVVTTITLCPQTDTVVCRLVVWKFKEPCLSKMPESMGSTTTCNQ
jgi:hypothetical protein